MHRKHDGPWQSSAGSWQSYIPPVCNSNVLETRKWGMQEDMTGQASHHFFRQSSVGCQQFLQHLRAVFQCA